MGSGTTTDAIIILGLLWLGVTAAIAVMAARRLRLAGLVIDAARTNAMLLERTPARPLLVMPDLRIDADGQLLRDLGIRGRPARLADLGGDDFGVLEDDLNRLTESVETARLSGGNISLKLSCIDSARVFEVRGGPAPASTAPGTLLLWFFNTSASEEERAKLALRLKQSDNALNSLTQLIEAAPFPMWYRGPDLKLGLVNSAYVQAVEGRDAADVIARGSELVEGPSEEGLEPAQQAQQSARIQTQMKPAIIRGERRMLKVVDVPLSSGAVAGFAVDVQDLEDAKLELARHIESQRELADRMTAGTAQFDSERVLSFYNAPFVVMSGLDPEWLAEMPEFDRLLEHMRDHQRLPEARDFPAWKEERRGWFTSAEEVIEEEWMLPSGDHFRVVAQPLPDGGLRLFLEDRTEQLRLSSARDTLLRVRTATFDNLYEAISVFASDGRLYLWNRRFIEDWDLDETWLTDHPRVDELVPAMARRLVNPTAAAQIRETVRHTTNERQLSSGRIAMTDGRQFQYAAVPLPDGNALLTMVDVTDSSRIEAALRERASALEAADKVKTDFVANVSYELRTPLTSIGGFAEMLAAGYAGDLGTNAKDYVDAILESVARLSRLIDDVLDLTTGDTRGIELEREQVDLAGLCRNALDTARPRVEEKAQKIEAKIAPTVGFVFGDARRLRESVEHLLNNAIAHSDRKSRIRIEADGDDEQAVITSHDNGPGIAKADIPRVFNRFDRVAEAGVRGEAALGLGLPLTRQFIEAHGGTVELQSAKGKGTHVTLTIPRDGK
ncbi:MAG: ATP-binding protein [Sphingomicrobium sp.]